MGLPVYGQDAGEAQESDELETDWYAFYCQAIAAGIGPREFGEMTHTQIHASIDASRLSRLNDMYFNVSDLVSNMDDDGVRKSLHGMGGGDKMRGKLMSKMMRPYLPSFMLPEAVQLSKQKPIEGLSPKAAEGIMQAVEAKRVSHKQWLAIHPVWQRVLATSRLYRPG